MELSDIYVTLYQPQDFAGTVESIRGLLERSHAQADWGITRAD